MKNSIGVDLEKDLSYIGLLDKAHEIYRELDGKAVISYIKSSYRLLSKIYHPDLNPDNKRKAIITQQVLNRVNDIVSKMTDTELLDVIKSGVVQEARWRNRILIVEDEESLLQMLESILTLEGYDVKTATNGVKGYEEYCKFRPNLILCDIVMPEMNGLELVARVRKLNQKVKVIYMSGLIGFSSLKRLLEKEAVQYGYHTLNKPFKPSLLLTVLKDYLQADTAWKKGISVVV